jgi:hypothetical protein
METNNFRQKKKDKVIKTAMGREKVKENFLAYRWDKWQHRKWR